MSKAPVNKTLNKNREQKVKRRIKNEWETRTENNEMIDVWQSGRLEIRRLECLGCKSRRIY